MTQWAGDVSSMSCSMKDDIPPALSYVHDGRPYCVPFSPKDLIHLHNLQ